MLAEIGFYLLVTAGFLSLYATGSSIASGLLAQRRLFRSAVHASHLSTLFIFLASLILWVLLFNRDYTVSYIFKNSSNDLPAMYTLTAFWSSLEGSHTLWTLFLAIVASLALATRAKDNEHIMPWFVASLQLVMTWMLYMATTHSDPFHRMFPPATNGRGMNELLQNPYMAIHPPMLFAGYTMLSVPYAYAVAALCFGDVTEGWLKSCRRWTIAAWMALSAGVWLGGRWAYVELGWAGYWAWDPVENSSFIPWLLATALMHSLLVQEKLGHLKRLSILLAVFAFFMSFFGTFLTRSGVVPSVHSFAESNIGPNYLAFLVVMLLLFVGLYAWKASAILPANVEKAWGPSRETALVLTQFLLLMLAGIVVIGTLFPILSEAITGQKTSIQAPYFNAFAPWIGLGMILVMAIGNLMRFQSPDIRFKKEAMRFAILFAVPTSALFIWFGDILQTRQSYALAAQIVGVTLVMWCAGCLLFDLYVRWGIDLRKDTKTLWRFNKAYIGALIAHMGFLAAILGFLGNYRGYSQELTFQTGETKTFSGYLMTFNGISVRENANVTLFEAVLDLQRNGETLPPLAVAKSRYPTKPELLNEIGVRSTFWKDLYVVMADFDRSTGKSATFQVHANPTVRLVWISVVLLVLGGLVALFDRRRGMRSRDVMFSEGATRAEVIS